MKMPKKIQRRAKYNEMNPKHFNFFQVLSVVPAGQVATASQPDAELFAAFVRTAERRLGDFNVQNLANTAWAFATAN